MGSDWVGGGRVALSRLMPAAEAGAECGPVLRALGTEREVVADGGSSRGAAGVEIRW